MPVTPTWSIFYRNTSTAAALEAESATQATSVDTALTTFSNSRAIRTYKWADAAARAVQTGMTEGDIGDQADTDVTYRYNGTSWVLIGVTPGSFARRIRTSGSYSPSATSWTDLTASFWDSSAANDITLTAAVGDVIESSMSAIADVQATETYWNVTCVASGNGFGPTASSARGIPAWMAINGAVTSIGGNFYYTVVSGDISSGNVALRLRSKNSAATGKSHLATADSPFVWVARNLGKIS